jgi:hypothetical protein
MKPLREYIVEAIQRNLSDFQKGLLASLTQAATGEQGYQTAVGSQNSISALHQLQMLGYVVVHGKAVGLTANGRQAAIQNNLIDQTGKLTSEGQQQVSDFNKNKQEYINAGH